MLERLATSKSKTFLAFCFSFLIGIAFASFYDRLTSLVWGYGIALGAGGLLITFWQHKTARLVLGCVLALTIGFFRYQIALLPAASVQTQTLAGKEMRITGVIADEPDVRIGNVRYVVEGENNEGRIAVTGGLYPRFQYGDVVHMRCLFERPEPIEIKDSAREFRYDMYLATKQVFLICSRPQITNSGSNEGNILYGSLLKIKNTVARQIEALWPEPHASLMAGLLYGYRGGLGPIEESFRRAGVAHILAVSGYNITMIGALFGWVLVRLYVPRKKAFWIVTTLIGLFVLFTGASGSVVRAGIMGELVLLATQVGRLRRIANVLVATAVAMTIHNPLVLWWDAGFQLSFLATVGLVYISPIIKNWLINYPDWWGIKEVLIATISATISTLPLSLYLFGGLSLIAPLANIVVLWIIPYLMLTGAVAVVAGSFIFIIGKWVAAISWLGMTYVIKIIERLSQLPFAYFSVSIPWWGMVVGYVFIIIFTVQLQTKQKPPEFS